MDNFYNGVSNEYHCADCDETICVDSEWSFRVECFSVNCPECGEFLD